MPGRPNPQSHKIVPQGVINRDVQLELVPPGHYLDARNLRLAGVRGGATAAPDGVQAQVEGNRPVAGQAEGEEFALPPGTLTQGVFHDPSRNRVYYWLSLPDGRGQVREYDVATDTIRVLLDSEVLDYPATPHGRTVNSAVLVGGRFLVWATSLVSGIDPAHPEGYQGPPRWLDLERGRFANFDAVTYQVYCWDEAALQGSYLFVVGTQGVRWPRTETNYQRSARPAPVAILTDARKRLRALGLACTQLRTGTQGRPYFEATTQQGTRAAVVVQPGGLAFVPTNQSDYDDGATARLLDLVRYPPRFAPRAEYVAAPEGSGTGAADLAREHYQFRCRYHYTDGSVSAWGPISSTPSPVGPRGLIDRTRTAAIRVYLNDNSLGTTALRSCLDQVEVAVRQGTTGLFRSLAALPMHQLDRHRPSVVFTGEQNLPVVPSDASGGSVTTQALKLFDSVPRGVTSVETVTDEDGNSLLVLGGCLEGGDAEPVSLNFAVSPDTAGAAGGGGAAAAAAAGGDCRVTIRGRIEIIRSSDQLTEVQNGVHSRRYTSARHDLRGSASGFCVYLAGTDYYGLSDSLASSPTGYFEITGVPPGEYTLRVAHPLCRFDDSAGAQHNLSRPGRAYQRTSAAVASCGAGSRPFERQLDLRRYAATDGGVFDLTQRGPISIRSGYESPRRRGQNITPDYYYEGYLRDGDDNPIAEQHLTITEEFIRPANLANRGDRGDSRTREFTARTDHNGLAFYLITNRDYAANYLPTRDRIAPADAWIDHRDPCGGPDRRVAVGSDLRLTDTDFIARVRRTVRGRVASAAGEPVAGIGVVLAGEGRTATTDAAGQYALSTYHRAGLQASQAGSSPVTLPLYFTNPGDACFAHDFDGKGGASLDLRLDVCGDAGKEYVINVVHDDDPAVAATEAGGAGTSAGGLHFKAGGRYRTAVVYEDRAGRKGEIIAGPTLEIPYHTTQPGGFTPQAVTFELTGTPPVWATHYRLLRSRNGVQASFQQRRVVDVLYVSLQGSGLAPKVIGTTTETTRTSSSTGRILRRTEQNRTLAARNPSTTHLLLRLDGVDRDEALLLEQATASGAGGVVAENEDTSARVLTYVPRGASPTPGSFTPPEGSPTPSLTVLFEQQGGSTLTAQQGDRLRLILTGDGDPIATDRVIETRVVGYHIDQTEVDTDPDDDTVAAAAAPPLPYYLIVEITEDLRNLILDGGELVEVYSPRTLRADQGLLYEMGAGYPITNPHTGGRAHGGGPEGPGRGTLHGSGGDVVWRQRTFYDPEQEVTFVRTVETGSLSDVKTAELYPDLGLGRPSPPAPGFPEQYRYYQLRTSNTFLQAGGRRQVGINEYLSADRQLINQRFGPIVRLLMLGNRLLVVCRHKVQPVYVAAEAVMDMSGNALIGRTDRLLNIAPEAAADYGSADPHSLVRGAGESVLGYDRDRGLAWRHGGNGTVDISRGLSGQLHAASCQDRLDGGDYPPVVAGFDPTYDEYLLRLPVVNPGEQEPQPQPQPQDPEQLVYALRFAAEQRRGWTSTYDFAPDLLMRCARDYVSLVGGKLYRHNATDSQAFYGVPIVAYLETVSNLDTGTADKLLHQLRYVGSTGIGGEVRVYNGSLAPSAELVQHSLLPAAGFVRRGSVAEAPFLRQQNVSFIPDALRALYTGPRLHGKVVVLRLSGPQMRLLSLDLTYSLLGDTKP